MYFFFSRYFFALFLVFLGFLSIEPLCSQRPSESAPSEPGYRPVWAEGTRLGVSLRLLLRHSEDLFPLGAILHLVPLTTDKTSGWSLASLLPLPLPAFLLALAPSFLSLASSVLWRSSLYNHHLATSRRARFPRNNTQLSFLFSFSSFFLLSNSLSRLPQVDTLCPGNLILQTRDVRWSKFVGTGKERNAFPFKKDLSRSRFFSFFLFPRTGLSSLSYLSWD